MNDDKVLDLAKQINALCAQSGLSVEEINAAGLIADKLRLLKGN